MSYEKLSQASKREKKLNERTNTPNTMHNTHALKLKLNWNSWVKNRTERGNVQKVNKNAPEFQKKKF